MKTVIVIVLNMSIVKDVSSWLLAGVSRVIQSIEDVEIINMINNLIDHKDYKILLLGSGRSGFVGRAFALRLMHLGFNVFVSGETITPALSPDDLVVALSGSGTTTTVVAQAEVAKGVGSMVIAVTSHPDSPLGKLADEVIVVKGRSKIDQIFDYDGRQIMGEYSNAPLGTMFELSCMIFLDSVIAELMQKLGASEVDLRKRHANAE